MKKTIDFSLEHLKNGLNLNFGFNSQKHSPKSISEIESIDKNINIFQTSKKSETLKYENLYD
jgi:hypothetical protein